MLCVGYDLATPTNTLHLSLWNHCNQIRYNIPIFNERWAYDIILASVPFLITVPHRHASHQKNILFTSGQISAGETEDTIYWMFFFIYSSLWGLLLYILSIKHAPQVLNPKFLAALIAYHTTALPSHNSTL